MTEEEADKLIAALTNHIASLLTLSRDCDMTNATNATRTGEDLKRELLQIHASDVKQTPGMPVVFDSACGFDPPSGFRLIYP